MLRNTVGRQKNQIKTPYVDLGSIKNTLMSMKINNIQKELRNGHFDDQRKKDIFRSKVDNGSTKETCYTYRLMFLYYMSYIKW